MREIKFRSWDGRRFSYWGFLDDRFDGPPSSSRVNYKTAIHEQYTGLKDKNGKEIYEGDIVSRFCGEQKSYIAFKDGEFIAWIVGEGGFVSARIECEVCEVIGNIHEDPELLEPRKEK